MNEKHKRAHKAALSIIVPLIVFFIIMIIAANIVIFVANTFGGIAAAIAFGVSATTIIYGIIYFVEYNS